MPRLLALTALVYLILVPGALAQGLCGSRDALVKGLAEKDDEQPALRGIDAAGRLVEVLVSPSGSWTILVTTAGRRICMSGTGEGLEPAPREFVQPGSPS